MGTRCKKTRGIQILGLLGSLGPPVHRPFTSEKSTPYSFLALIKAKFVKALNSKSIKLDYSSSAYFFSRIFFDVLPMQLRPICIHISSSTSRKSQVDAVTSAVAYAHSTRDECGEVFALLEKLSLVWHDECFKNLFRSQFAGLKWFLCD